MSKTQSPARTIISPEKWLEQRGQAPFSFQREVWDAYSSGQSGLIHATTGSGKTLAVIGGVLEAAVRDGDITSRPARLIWLTPLRALAEDTRRALSEVVEGCGLPWRVELRTGDTTESVKRRQAARLPDILVTTPESLSLLLTYPNTYEALGKVSCVVVDEWHELLGTKRGVQVELAIATVKSFHPAVQVWGLSATLRDVDGAARLLVGHDRPYRVVQTSRERRIDLETLYPERIERFTWVGHYGTAMMPQVLEACDSAQTTLIFANTRAQSEVWYHALLEARPEWAGEIALHHGSLDRDLRRWVERELAIGKLRAVVCTSTLDLGVDFPPVDQVIHLGSPKGIGRFLQRSGRSGHQPGGVSRVKCVPTHAFELLEYGALRKALIRKDPVEERTTRTVPLDVLLQHVLTMCAGRNFTPEELLRTIKLAPSFSSLTREDWDWAVGFLQGHEAFAAYEEFKRVRMESGHLMLSSPRELKRQRLAIGTIVGDAAVTVKLRSGKTLGTIEESFVSTLKRGDVFLFSGRLLEMVTLKDMKAVVKPAKGRGHKLTRWPGGRMPLSTEVGRVLKEVLGEWKDGVKTSEEIEKASPLLALQEKWSAVPTSAECLVEVIDMPRLQILCFYPFEGRRRNEGIANIVANRIAGAEKLSLRVGANDYGAILTLTKRLEWAEQNVRELFDEGDAVAHLEHWVNLTELQKRQFREIARVAGLVSQGFPSRSKSAKQLQVSSGLLYDVLASYDPGNLLLRQAKEEVLRDVLNVEGVLDGLRSLASKTIVLRHVPRLTPFAFPLWAEQTQSEFSSESFKERLARMTLVLEQEATKETSRRARKIGRAS